MEQESNRDKNKNLSSKLHLNKNKPYLKDVIKDLQQSNMWNVQLKVTVNFIFSKDDEQVRDVNS